MVETEIFNRLNRYYFHKTYNMVKKITQEDEDWIANNTFKCKITEATKNNGWEGAAERLFKNLELNKVYTLESMSIGQSSGDVFLVEVPGIGFNTVNFEYHIDNE